MPPKITSAKLPSLDGWRAVSITLVLLCHSCFTAGFPAWLNPILIDWLQIGTMGVYFFFVISGFLITYLLLQEQAKHGVISLKHFYLRRALRILPVYFFYLLVLGCLTRYSQPASVWLANATFTTNYFLVPEGTAHFWSLGVEEQFYLLWPGILVLVLHRARGANALIKVLVLPLIFVPVLRILACKSWYPHAWYPLFNSASFILNCDALAYGCLAAVLFARRREWLQNFLGKTPLATAVFGLGLILAPAVLQKLHLPTRIRVMITGSSWAVGFGLLLLQSVLWPSLKAYRWLNWKWVQHLGVLSYSIYIWQQMFCGTGETIFGVKDAWWTNFPVWLITTLLAAHASYYLLEKPLLGLRARFREA